MKTITEFLSDVFYELERAQSKYPAPNPNVAALSGECGEVCEAMNKEPFVNVYTECVQTAAVAARLALEGDAYMDEYRLSVGLDASVPEAIAQPMLADLAILARDEIKSLRAQFDALKPLVKHHKYMVSAVAERMEENDGFWHACSGCQESDEGYVSPELWPRSEIFQCQPGAGCHECGGIGVIWDTTDWEAVEKSMTEGE